MTIYEPDYVEAEPEIADPQKLEIEHLGNTWVITGLWLERLIMNINFDARSSYVQNEFKKNLPLNASEIRYIKVPRGLIVSIAENIFFAQNSTRISPKGQQLLQSIAMVLSKFNNKCVIESHTDETIEQASGYKEDWEISIHRANVIAQYLIQCCKVSSDRIYTIGFGNTMPFNEKISDSQFTDNRINFVIFDYTFRR